MDLELVLEEHQKSLTLNLTWLFGKSLGNGYPISAIVGKNIMNLMNEVFVSGTFAGETLSMAAALATLKKLEKI